MCQNTAYVVSYIGNPAPDTQLDVKMAIITIMKDTMSVFPITVLPRSAGTTLFVPPPIYCYSILPNRTTKLKTITRFGSDIW